MYSLIYTFSSLSFSLLLEAGQWLSCTYTFFPTVGTSKCSHALSECHIFYDWNNLGHVVSRIEFLWDTITYILQTYQTVIVLGKLEFMESLMKWDFDDLYSFHIVRTLTMNIMMAAQRA
jgi:hypothetical protein